MSNLTKTFLSKYSAAIGGTSVRSRTLSRDMLIWRFDCDAAHVDLKTKRRCSEPCASVTSDKFDNWDMMNLNDAAAAALAGRCWSCHGHSTASAACPAAQQLSAPADRTTYVCQWAGELWGTWGLVIKLTYINLSRPWCRPWLRPVLDQTDLLA